MMPSKTKNYFLAEIETLPNAFFPKVHFEVSRHASLENAIDYCKMNSIGPKATGAWSIYEIHSQSLKAVIVKQNETTKTIGELSHD